MARWKMLASVVVLSVALGCAAQPITQRAVMIPMRDGVKLASDIVRPNKEGKVPAVLVRTPYRKNTNGGAALAAVGCALVCQDVRGRYNSEGEHAPFLYEADDAYDTIAWIAKQPWCNGDVAMHGGSYVGYTQLAAAMSGAPALKCIMPAVPPADFDYGTACFGGALRMELVQGWLMGQARTSQRVMLGRVPADELAEHLKNADFKKWAWHLPLSDPGPIAAGGPGYAKGWNEMMSSWEKPGAWEKCSAVRRAADIKVPVFIKAGFYDIFAQEDIDLLLALRKNGGSELSRKHSHLLIGPWVHGLGRPAGEADFPNAKSALATVDQKWLLRWLGGQPSEVDQWPAIRAYVMHQDKWIDTDEWPPANTAPARFYLDGKSLSTRAPGADAASDTYSYDPANPVSTLGGNNLTIINGVRDHRKNAARGDVLSFATPALEKDLTVIGPVKAHLFVSTDAPDTDFTVMLLDIRPDGYAANVLDGIVRLRYRNSREKPEFVTPGQVVEVDVNLWSTAYNFKAGHRLAVHVSSSNFPRFDRHLNVAESPVKWTTPKVAKNTVHRDAARASYIELPVTKS